MTKRNGTDGDDPRVGRDTSTPHSLHRTVQYYGLLMGVIGCVNIWLFWAEGLRLSLWLGIACFVCLVAWIVFAKRTLR